jgi:site-specific DNA-adenine methylase
MNKAHRIFLFSYYGGKSKISHLYPRPIYDTIVEPFAGAANYSCLHFKKKVVLYELNPVIFGILDFLVRSSQKEILNLPLLKEGQKVSDLTGINQEARWLIGMGVNAGTVSPKNSLTSMAKESPSSNWSSQYRRQLSYFVEKIKHWKVFNLSCWDAFEREGESTWFIDPPYQGHAGTAYPFGSHKLDFKKLGTTVQKLPGQVIVCEGESADYLPFRRLTKDGSMEKKNGPVKKRKWEMIWTKGCLESVESERLF